MVRTQHLQKSVLVDHECSLCAREVLLEEWHVHAWEPVMEEVWVYHLLCYQAVTNTLLDE